MKVYKNAERTKKWIKKAFLELLAEKKTLNKITVVELAQRADITKTTFYYHYDDIFAIADEIANEMINELSAVLDELKISQKPDYSVFIKRTINFLKEKEADYKMIIGSTDLVFFIDKLKKLGFKKLNAPGLDFSQNSTIRQIQITFLISAYVDTIVEYFKGNLNCTLDQIEIVLQEAINKLKIKNSQN